VANPTVTAPAPSRWRSSTPGLPSADVGVTSTILKDHLGGAYLIGMPDEARRFVADIDAGRAVAPFGFNVTLN
jgi:hypothetical protein